MRKGEITHIYDPVNEVWNEITETAHPELHTAYDAAGNVVSVTNARGFTSFTLYDRANRPVVSISPRSAVFDPDTGNLTELHTVSKTLYDRNGNVLKQQTGTVSQALADVAAAQAAVPVITRTHVENTWDALNRLVSTTDAANITVTNQYDAKNNLTSVTDGKNQRTEFEYDGLGRNTVTRHPDQSEKTLTHNALVQTGRADENGRITAYSYDLLNRLHTVDYDDNGVIDRQYSYDAVGNILQVNEPGTLADVAYTYDALNRVITETSLGVTHTYTHDLAGNRIHTRYGDGLGGVRLTLYSTYDALNRTLTVLEDANGNDQPDAGERLSGYHYDLAGGIRIQTQPNGHRIEKQLDALGRAHTLLGPDGADDLPLYRYAHAFDLYGNLARIGETYPSQDAQLEDRTLINLYDPANRLLTETVQTGNEIVETAYTYDNAHNRTAKTVTLDDGTQSIHLEQAVYTFTNALNQISTYHDTVSGRTAAFSYDPAGNRTHRFADTTGDSVIDETTVYTYDAENRLLTHEKTAGGAPEIHRYAYDYRTRRVRRDESGAGGKRTLVVFSGGLSAQEWEDVNNSQSIVPAFDIPHVQYVRGSDYGGGIGGVLYTLRDLNEDGQLNNAAFNHYNSRGDVVARVDDAGALLYQAAYEAFGRHGDTPGSQEWGETADRQKANTKDEDPTGLLNEGFRYRCLETGVFITRDPLGFVDGPNVYTYVIQNPWTFFDPLGLEAMYVLFPAQPINVDQGNYLRNQAMRFMAKERGIGVYKDDKGTWRSNEIGHAGVVLIHPKTGETSYYEFGRYAPGGSVRTAPKDPNDADRRYEVPGLSLPDATFDKNGNVTDESIIAILRALSNENNTFVRGILFNESKSDPQAMESAMHNYKSQIQYAEDRRSHNRDPNRNIYCHETNNCGDFAREVVNAGRNGTEKLPDTSPIPNHDAYNFSHKGDVINYDPDQKDK